MPRKQPEKTPETIPDSFQSPESSTIVGATYDKDTQTLLVTFKHENMTYRYVGVPALVWGAFYQAESRGKFFQQRIRPIWSGVRVE